MSKSNVYDVLGRTGTGKLVGSKQKSVLSESVLTVLSYVGINRDLAAGRKKVHIDRVSVISWSAVMKFYCKCSR